MIDAFVAGLFVGLFVAVFVGAAAMVVVETAIQQGLSVALAGGGGIATGDALWAALAAGAGAAISRLFEPWAAVLQWTAAGVLAAILALALRELFRSGPLADPVDLPGSPLRAYADFLAHTLRHPTTVVFFISLIVGAGPDYGAGEAVAFVVGVFLASLSWQVLLAVAGARRRRAFSSRVRRGVLAVDCALLALFIVYIALGLYRY
ncbi:MAG: LysE family transporter [Mycobacterium sp.]|nr:LysE family transporter [Mycobacterium sp.]